MRILLITVSLLLVNVHAKGKRPKETPESYVCQDPVYLQLKNRNIDSLTDKEFQFFLLKEKSCNDLKIKQEVSGAEKSANTSKTISNIVGTLATLAGLGVMIFFLNRSL